ncbi:MULTISPECIES: arylsulfatase [Chitinophaga]|uniref:sulfatase family protein n=1 Tax=Chitinophaga TaxID=79328 RepID=UPI000BAFA508|nr:MULTISPECIES: arylsulfatase [Chitinophaga]ASZ12992.1 arylsulfatase [Chitinophaga sp. MD30]
MKRLRLKLRMTGIGICALLSISVYGQSAQRPNIVLIYADDLGFGDVSCYGAKRISTPNIDQLARQGVRFTNAHASSSTCTPSRYSMLTGEYAWRHAGTGIAPGNAALIIPQDRITLPGMLQRAGYQTAAIGKWHLGIGGPEGPDWNGELKPGPLEVGFNYAFLMPATADRVPCVFVEDHRVVNLDPADPITVSYKQPLGDAPTGRNNPELLKMKASHGHDQAIVNGVGRIGYMTGGKRALWVDEDLAKTFTDKAISFITQHRQQPFFVYLATHDIHVPRVPHSQFAGKSGMGPRGDAILQLDWTVGRIMETLQRLQLSDNTIVIFSSDNGPVVDDGYQDQAVELLGSHRPSGPLRGGKYSAFDAGTRIPMIVRWPGQVKKGTSGALLSQVDLLATLAKLTGQSLGQEDAPDSFDMLPAFLHQSEKGRNSLVAHAGVLSIIRGDWKYIPASKGPRKDNHVNIELGNDPAPQLYDLRKDLGEQRNVAATHPALVKELAAELDRIRTKGSERP